MNLEKLISSTNIKKICGWIKDVEIENISISSRHKAKNTLFIAQRGVNFDGHNFVDEAIINGAVALVLEKEIPQYSIPQIIVKSTRVAIGTIASEFFGNPSSRLKFVGITGTNGKTSCSLFLSKMLEKAGKKTAVIGTLGAYSGNKTYNSKLTTPDPLEFHSLLSEFVSDGIEYVVMECSAHALALKKLDNIIFEVGIITNITQDHLDFFGTMQNYAHAKLSWLIGGNVKNVVFNADDKFSQHLYYKKSKALSYGINSPADVFALDIENHSCGSSFILNLLDNVFECETPLVGEFNIYNIMAVATAGLYLGLSFETIIQSIKEFSPPEGRFNVITIDDDKSIVIDFAHTPDSLKNVLSTARGICKKRLISVFGCGGDRDRSKRPIMGSISEALADFTIITSDNPRFEKPEKILSEIESGMRNHNYFKISDRKLAIRKTIEMLNPGDVAVICGKGGEKYQDINGIKIPYDDFEEVQKAIKEIYAEANINVGGRIC